MTDPANVDALREKLRGLGYLDAGVDRFVLAPARTGLGTWGLGWRASARIGLLAAVLVGVPATVAIATRFPTLVTGVADAALLALYIGLVVGATTTVVSLVVLLAAARVGRWASTRADFAKRAPRVARAAGVLVALASLGYLTLWWRAVASTASSATFPATALALGVATVVALLLGHTTTVVALAVLAGSSTTAGEAPRLEQSWKVRAVLALVAILASATLFALVPRRDAPHEDSAPALVVVPTGLRLLIVGVDGLDPAFAEALARRDSLSTLLAGLTAPRVEMGRDAGRDPVAVWMTIATAQPPERHGALGVEARRLAGLAGRIPGEAAGLGALMAASTDLLRLTQPVVSSAAERRERTFWELAAAAGLRTLAVNWWTTWPAANQDGVVLTDRAPLRLARGGPLQGELAPASLYDTLRPQWSGIDATVDRTIAPFAAGLADPDADIVTRAAGLDATQVVLATQVGLADADLATVYLPGVDVAQATLFAGDRAQAASTLARRVTALERVYRHLDQALATLRRAAPDHVLVLVTHPGRVADDVPALMTVDGLGPASGQARARRAPRLEDVGATVLQLAGVPISRQLTGQVRTELLPAEFIDRHAPRYVDRYAARVTTPAARPGGDALDDEARERLRSLGYVR